MNAANALAELKARISWTLARIGEVVNAGRDAGWLSGQVVAVPDSDSCLDGLSKSESTPMDLFCARLELRPLEVDLLWLLACIELDPQVSHAAALLMHAGTHELSAQILERLVARSGVLEPEMFERLHRLAIIETDFDPRVPFYRRPVRVQDRVVDIARGVFGLDRALRGVATLETELDVRRMTPGISLEVPREVIAATAPGRRSLIVATGVEGSGRRTLLRRAIASSGRSVLAIRAADLSRDPETLRTELRALARECRLHHASPLICGIDEAVESQPMIERELIEAVPTSVFATARENISAKTTVPVVSVRAAVMTAVERTALWRTSLPEAGPNVVDECAARYAVPPGLVRRAAESALAAAGGGPLQVAHLHAGLRAHVDRELADTARRIETTQTWDDLVLPVDQFDLLIELVARVRRRGQVLDDWGFAEKVGRGLGTAALLSGPPGTGKTMIAGLLARELGLDLYQVDLSKIVSKYIGETEKQLARLFDMAESGHAILLFDEADSIFAKRTEVKSSNDRYANLEVNYLLQRMESFAGITLLTTNHEAAIDQAFLRRLASHIRVPMPEERERELMWRAMLPAAAPVASDLDVTDLARRFAMSGGYIRNAALRAAFMAADEGSAITTRHLECAAKLEYEGMGKIAA